MPKGGERPMSFTFEVTVELLRTEGRFASRDEIAEKIMDELDVDPGTIEGDEGGQYDVTCFAISEVAPEVVKRRLAAGL